MEEKTSVFSNGLIWFGAAVSIAEILTGTLIAPLGFQRGLAAIIIGHIIGCIILYLAGLIGANTEKSAMDTVKISFGDRGSVFFSTLNLLQLVGWTAIMIVSGALSANSVMLIGGDWGWSIIIGILIVVWLVVGAKNLDKINTLAMSGLFILTVIMSTVIFKGNIAGIVSGDISFGAAIELSATMPLSWLPLISDYTRKAKKKRASTFASALVYFLTSCWMYVIGMGAAIYTGETDIAKIMITAGLGGAGLFIIIFSTVTTTFLDAYSAGVSANSISNKVNEKLAGIVVTVIGTLLAIFTPIFQMEGFLYLIGSVFAPMISILLTDYYILKKDNSDKTLDIKNFILWAIGFAIYRYFLKIDTPIGNTLPVMIIVSVMCVISNKFAEAKNEY